jgi:hypothetical protein
LGHAPSEPPALPCHVARLSQPDCSQGTNGDCPTVLPSTPEHTRHAGKTAGLSPSVPPPADRTLPEFAPAHNGQSGWNSRATGMTWEKLAFPGWDVWGLSLRPIFTI